MSKWLFVIGLMLLPVFAFADCKPKDFSCLINEACESHAKTAPNKRATKERATNTKRTPSCKNAEKSKERDKKDVRDTRQDFQTSN